MLRLLKLAAYSLLGYVLYELILGLTEGGQPSAAPAASQARSPTRASNITGPGEGATITASDSDGAQARHRVGRGVVS